MKKKIRVMFLSLLAIILITGCGKAKEKEQQLVCKSTENEDGMSIEQVISMTYKNDKLSYMTMEVNTKITDSTVQNNWEKFKESMNEQNKEYSKDGVTLKVETDDKNFEYKTKLDIDVLNASEEALKQEGFSDLKEDNSTLESSRQSAIEDGAVCEVK